MSTSTSGLGTAGNLNVQATESVLVSGTDDFNFSSTLRATVQLGAAGDGGNLTIETGRLIVQDGGQVLTSTFGRGNAGDLTVQNAMKVELVGGVIVDDTFVPSGLLTNAARGSMGTGGNLTISTEKLTIRDGVKVAATTFSMARAGDMTVRATDIELVGDALSADGDLFTNDRGLPYPSGLFAGTQIDSQGDGAP